MRSYSKILLLLAVACSMGACSKNKDREDPNEGTVLKRYETTFDDTLVVYHFYERDASNKIITVRDSAKTGQFTLRLEYGSNGKVSRVGLLDPGSSNDLYYHEFEYNADGRISKKKTRAGTNNMPADYHTYAYDVMGHLVADTLYSTGNNTTFYLAFVNKYRYTGNNVTEAEAYVIVNNGLHLDRRHKYEYDSGKNPFKSIEIEYYLRGGGTTGAYDIQAISENNVVSESSAIGNEDYHGFQRYSHQYNSSNTAWKSRLLPMSPQQSERVREYFFE